MASNFPLMQEQICPHCGVTNEPMAMICSDCQTALPLKDSTPNLRTWRCAGCSFENVDADDNCAICDAPRYAFSNGELPATSKLNDQLVTRTDKEALSKELVDKINQLTQKCIKEQKLFADEEFPSTADSISRKACAQRDVVVEWRRPEMVVVKDEDADLLWKVFDNPKAADVFQGFAGDCWLISTMSLIAERPYLLKKIFVRDEYNKYGVYGVQICLNGKWTNVIVDDLLPCDEEGMLAFALAKRKQLWVPLLEKAVAKVYRGYICLWGGATLANSLTMLTGHATFTYDLARQCEGQLEMNYLHRKLRYALDNNLLIACSTPSQTGDVDYDSVHLQPDHAYSVIALRTVFFEPLILLRSSHQNKSWTGKWSDHSDSWNDILPELRPEEGIGDSEKGLFWMSMEDFKKYFEAVAICYVRENWYEYRVKNQLPRLKDKYMSCFQMDIFETTTVDLHLQFSAGNQEEGSLEAIMLIYDEDWRLLGTTKCTFCIDMSWASKLLTAGRCYIYLFSHTVWQYQALTEYVFICHSNQNIQITKIERHTSTLADVLFYYIKEFGKNTSQTGDGGVYTYEIVYPHWWGYMVAVVNETSKLYILEVAPLYTDSPLQSRLGLVRDVVRANTRQILQIETTGIFDKTNPKVPVTACPVKSSSGPKKGCDPKLTQDTKKIHRQIPR